VPSVLATGYAMPALGVSLVAFLAIDLVVGAVRRRRAARVAPVSPAVGGTAEPAAQDRAENVRRRHGVPDGQVDPDATRR
jgi:hypothetical protein